MNRCDCPTEEEEARLRLHLPKIHPRNRLLIELGLETGLPLVALLRLRVSDVWSTRGTPRDYLACSVSTKQPNSRTPFKDRRVPLNRKAQEALRIYFSQIGRRSPHALLFPSRVAAAELDPASASRLVRKICEQAGLPRYKTWGGGSLRRRFVRRIYDLHGLNVARAAAGHSWIATTATTLGLEEEEAQSAVLELGGIGSVLP